MGCTLVGARPQQTGEGQWAGMEGEGQRGGPRREEEGEVRGSLTVLELHSLLQRHQFLPPLSQTCHARSRRGRTREAGSGRLVACYRWA